MAAVAQQPATNAVALATRNPTKALQDSLLEFKSILTQEERDGLDKDGVPDGIAVLTFTASLDRMDPARRGASVATRFYSFLQSVQQFTGVVDVFVSSNPAIAALVWGSVRFTMMFMVRFTSYFQDLSKLFLGFQTWCPRFEEYRLLFPSSTRLQEALSTFYSSLVRCCKDIILITRRSMIGHAVNALCQSFSSETKPLLERVKIAAKEVKDEVYLAKAQADLEDQRLQAMERDAAANQRKSLIPFISKTNKALDQASESRKRVERRREVKRRQALLDELSDFDYLATFKLARSKRHQGTGVWFPQTEQFRSWRGATSSSALCLSGNCMSPFYARGSGYAELRVRELHSLTHASVGCGKTVLCASVVDDLLTNRTDNDRILFFFPNAEQPASLHAETILRSLARQSLQAETLSDKTEVQLRNAQGRVWLTASVCAVFESVAGALAAGSLYVIIDALDELEQNERKTLLASLASLMKSQSAPIKLLIACRPGLRPELDRALPNFGQLVMDSCSTQTDLNVYTNEIVMEKVRLGELVVTEEAVVSEVIQALTDEAQGMFLWVALEIDEICSQVCDEDIRRTLKALPKSLEEVFERALGRIVKHGKVDICRSVFTWIVGAKRPMLLEELQEALPIMIDQEFTRPERAISAIEKLSAWCENLVEINEIDGTVHFIHSTVRQFIVGAACAPLTEYLHVNPAHAHNFIGRICLTYLNFNDFKTTVATQKLPAVLPLSNTKRMAAAVLQSGLKRKTAKTMTRIFFRDDDYNRPESNFLGALATFGRADLSPERLIEVHPFLRYASHFWLQHTSSLRFSGGEKHLWNQMIQGDHDLAKPPWPAAPLQENGAVVMEWAISHKHYTLARHLVEYVKVTGFEDGKAWDYVLAKLSRLEDSALYHDFMSRDYQHVPPRRFREALLCWYLPFPMQEQARDLNPTLDIPYNTNETVENDAQMFEAIRLQVFELAVRHCDANAMEYMLVADKTLARQGFLWYFLTSSSLAAWSKGIHDCTRVLLSHGVDPDGGPIKGYAKGRPLHAAVKYALLDLVGMLVRAGADVSALDNDGIPPLRYALELGDRKQSIEISTILVAAGADPKTAGQNGNTVWHLINEKDNLGEEEAVHRLLSAIQSYRPAAGWYTARRGKHHTFVKAHHMFIEEFVRADRDPPWRDAEGSTVLHYAARVHNHVLVRYLIKQGMKTDVRDTRHRTPFLVALEQTLKEPLRDLPANSPIVRTMSELLLFHPLVVAKILNRKGIFASASRTSIFQVNESQVNELRRAIRNGDSISCLVIESGIYRMGFNGLKLRYDPEIYLFRRANPGPPTRKVEGEN